MYELNIPDVHAFARRSNVARAYEKERPCDRRLSAYGQRMGEKDAPDEIFTTSAALGSSAVFISVEVVGIASES